MAIVQRGRWGSDSGGGPFRLEWVPDTIVFTIGDLGGNSIITGMRFEKSGETPVQAGAPPTPETSDTWSLAGKTLASMTAAWAHSDEWDCVVLYALMAETTASENLSAGDIMPGYNSTTMAFSVTRSLAGFAGDSGDVVNMLSALVEEQDVEVQVALDVDATPSITVDVVGKVELVTNDTLKWVVCPGTMSAFTFSQILFFTDAQETHQIGGWNVNEPIQLDPDFPYDLVTTTTSELKIKDNERPQSPADYWYKLWVEDDQGHLHVLDPEIINFTQRH